MKLIRRKSRQGDGSGRLRPWEATEILPDPDRLLAELEALRYAVERVRLRDKADLPAILGVAPVSRPDGASSVCRSLATVLALDPDPSVCFVDLNRWSWDVGTENRSGVVDVIRGTASLDEALVATANPRLQYLPLGGVDDPQTSHLQRSRELEMLLERLRTSFNHVVVELPPLRTSSEALAIASYCEGCVVVVEQGVTTRSELREALDSLGGVRVLGVVMDQVRSKVPGFLLRMLAE